MYTLLYDFVGIQYTKSVKSIKAYIRNPSFIHLKYILHHKWIKCFKCREFLMEFLIVLCRFLFCSFLSFKYLTMLRVFSSIEGKNLVINVDFAFYVFHQESSKYICLLPTKKMRIQLFYLLYLRIMFDKT